MMCDGHGTKHLDTYGVGIRRDCVPSLHRREWREPPVEPTVTLMSTNGVLHSDPSTVCIVDAKSAIDFLIRESTGGHRRPGTLCNPTKHA